MAIKGNNKLSQLIKGNNKLSQIIKGNKKHSQLIKGNNKHSQLIKGNNKHSQLIKGNNPRQLKIILPYFRFLKYVRITDCRSNKQYQVPVNMQISSDGLYHFPVTENKDTFLTLVFYYLLLYYSKYNIHFMYFCLFVLHYFAFDHVWE